MSIKQIQSDGYNSLLKQKSRKIDNLKQQLTSSNSPYKVRDDEYEIILQKKEKLLQEVQH